MLSETTPTPLDAREYALIVQLTDSPQPALENFLRLLLHFQYGLQLFTARSLEDARRRLDIYPQQIGAVFVLQANLANQSDLRLLSTGRDLPFFLLLPHSLLPPSADHFADLDHVHCCALEQISGRGKAGLGPLVSAVFARCGIQNLLGSEDRSPEGVERRLQKIHTLPTLPQVVLRIMHLVDDPESTIEDLEQLLISDPAIVLKLHQVLTSPLFAASGRRSEWSLQESIVRLGLKKVGAIAQQIALMNGLVKPQHSPFNLERFWRHSTSCALIANWLCADRLIPLKKMPEFNAYWMGGLLHDIGKLVLGFFFPQRYREIRACLQSAPGLTFRKAEARLGDVASHDYLGQLLLLKSRVSPVLVGTVADHHVRNQPPGDLACLLHLANQLSKDLGLGYLPGEKGMYSALVLRRLGRDAEYVQALAEQLRPRVADEVELLMAHCR